MDFNSFEFIDYEIFDGAWRKFRPMVQAFNHRII